MVALNGHDGPVAKRQRLAPEPTCGQAQIKLGSMATLSSWDEVKDSFRRKCRIVCTMGPNIDKGGVPLLLDMMDAGMDVCRLNFSHGDFEEHGGRVKMIREAMKQRPDKQVAILLDTKGPEIRTGFFKAGGKIELKQGQELKLVTDYSFKGDNTCIALSYDKLTEAVKPGSIILIADGSLSLKVKSVGDGHVMTDVMNNCLLGERKNCNLPGVKVDLPILQEKDQHDILQFGIPNAVDFVAASFVQSAEDVRTVRKTLGLRGRNIKIISKIENEEGLRNFDEILDATDGIMVARGDLGMEIPPENVFLAQKMMIARCNIKGKPVITATQMLESMTGQPRPTRAEAGDVANAVLDGTDCVMLSGETAQGDFPLNAVSVMRRIVQKAEAALDHNSLYFSIRNGVVDNFGTLDAVESVCSSAVKAAMECEATLLLALTETGHTARVLAKYRPMAPILAISASQSTQRHLLCVRGVVSVHTASFQGTDSVISKGIVRAKELGMVKSGDSVVVVHGQKEECPGASNLMKVVTAP